METKEKQEQAKAEGLTRLFRKALHLLEQGPQLDDHDQHHQQNQGNQRHEHPGQLRGDHKAEHRREHQHAGGSHQIFGFSA